MTQTLSDPTASSTAVPSTAQRARPGEPAIESWGRIRAPGREVLTGDLVTASEGAVLSRGLGRSYGDSSLPARSTDKVLGTRLANRLIAFDAATGVLRVEAGVCLADINRTFIPRGWFTPVTPGTKYVTVGGMVASDVHGKNHHVDGCFGAHVRELTVRLADGDIVTCSPTEMSDLFYGTIGGMGLLGHILEVELTMKRIASPWIWMEVERVPDIDSFLESLSRNATHLPMTMGWIDCLSQGSQMGRGIMMGGHWATPEQVGHLGPPKERKPITFPVNLPNWALNPFTAKLFNDLYFWKQLAARDGGLVSPETFFYPLDVILEWNKGYGTRGFTQYQCVLPRAAGAPAVREFMRLLTRLGGASPLCVIKDCGPESQAVLSFPLEGTSIAIDMAIEPGLQSIVDRLNEFVIAAGGRIYLTKDLFTRPEHFRAMEPRLPRFFALRDKYDPHRRLRSAQSVRLFGDEA